MGWPAASLPFDWAKGSKTLSRAELAILGLNSGARRPCKEQKRTLSKSHGHSTGLAFVPAIALRHGT